MTVPGLVVLLLVVVTGAGVWTLMTWRRILASRRRIMGQSREIEQDNLHLRQILAGAEAAAETAVRAAAEAHERIGVLQARRHVLEKILAVSAQMNATRNRSELMTRIVGAVSDISGFNRVVLYVWSDVTSAFEVGAISGVGDPDLAEPSTTWVREIEFTQRGQLQQRLGNCYLAREIVGDDGLYPATGTNVWDDGQMLIAPLIAAVGTAIGYLVFDEPQAGVVPPLVEIQQLEFLAQQATTAIESVDVYQKLALNNTELSAASEKLNSLAEMKKNFVANVSHELRTPLTSISAYSEILQKNINTLTGPARDEFLKVIHAESVKLSGVVDDILELSQMDSVRPALTHAATNVAALVQKLADSWRERALKQGLELVVDIESEEIVMPVDGVLIQQLLNHLMGNALKFTPDGGSVRVGLQESGTAVRLTVADTGIGIPEAQLGEIFDRFFQVDGSTTREHSGQGLGLALCHDIVSNHEGRIWAENVPTGGAQLTVLLPRRPAVLQPVTLAAAGGHPFDSGEFIERLMLWISESMGVQVVSLLMPLASDDFLSVRAAIGLPETVVQSAQVRRGEGFAGGVWQSGETLLLADVTAADRGESEPRYSTPSLLCVPLMAGDEVIGVITANNRIDGRALDDDDRVFLESLVPRVSALLVELGQWQETSARLDKTRETLRVTTTVGHVRHETIVQVCQEICLKTARRIMLPAHELEHLAFSLQFYDVGLSCVPPQLLNKPGPFDRHEEKLVQDHVAAGLEILEPLGLDARVRQIISHHHENYDGSGYPAGLAGEAISLAARLVRLTDTLSALLSRRPWREAYTLDEAVAEIQAGTGREYCPRMTGVFLEEVATQRDRILALQATSDDGPELKRPALDQRGLQAARLCPD